MTLRLEYRDVAPEAVRALGALDAYISGSSIEPRFRRLLEIRTSLINGCSYCVQVHRRQALALGESEARLDALANWRASDLFTEQERVALAWSEDVTLIAERGAPEAHYAPLGAHFSEKEIVDLTFVVLTMNAMNRLAISFGREAPEQPARPAR